MRKRSKLKISRLLCGNCSFNKTVIRLKRSWDEVESILCNGNRCNFQCDRRHNHKHNCDHHYDHDHDFDYHHENGHDYDHDHDHHHKYDHHHDFDDHKGCGCDHGHDEH